MLNRIRTIINVSIIIVLLLSSSLTFGEQPASAAEGEETNLPPLELPAKGDPKLDSQLNQLVTAKTQNQAISFAQQSNIELTADTVRVIIEAMPGQLVAAREAASALGVSVETRLR